jgi:DUF1009 family protein
MDFGKSVALEVARLDIGQTICVKDLAVVAVEAMEGTDAVIKRAGEITRGRPFVVVKVAKPNQDMRFDVPVIGLSTVKTMADCGATAMHVTADKTLVFDREELVEFADRKGISIVADKCL